MRNRSRCLCQIVVLAGFLCQTLSTPAGAAPPLTKGKDCICAPNPYTYGYFPARWRRWPSEGFYGEPTPAMMQQGEVHGMPGSAPEELPNLTPPGDETPPAQFPEGPELPPETLPDAEPGNPPLDVPDAPDQTPPRGETPAATPEPQPAQPTLPPAAPGDLPEDPLAPPAEPDDDPVPALPQSLLEPEGEVPNLTKVPSVNRPTRYQMPAADALDVDETGLPSLRLPSNEEVEAAEVQAPLPGLPAVDQEIKPAAPQLLEPSPGAQPVDAGDANTWSPHRRNPLRGASAPRRDVQQAAHWQKTAPAVPATTHPAPLATQAPSRMRAVTPQGGRDNPLRGSGGQ